MIIQAEMKEFEDQGKLIIRLINPLGLENLQTMIAERMEIIMEKEQGEGKSLKIFINLS